MGRGLVAAGLGASLPIFTTSAAPDQQVLPPGGAVGSVSGPGTNGVNPNATPTIALNGSETKSYIGYDFKPITSSSSYSCGPFGGITWTGGDNNF